MLLHLGCLFGMVLPSSGMAADPAQHFYLGQHNASYTVSAWTVTNPPVNVATAASGSNITAVTVDSAANIVYGRVVNDRSILAFSATDLSRRSSLDIDTVYSNGGALEVDPYRRVLYAHDGDGRLRAYSIDPSNFGTVLSQTDEVSGYAGTDETQLALDYLSDTLFSAASEGGELKLYAYDVSGMSFRGGTFPAGQVVTGISLGSEKSFAIDVPGRRLFVQTASYTGGVEVYDISSAPQASHLSQLATLASARDCADCGLLYAQTDTIELLVETSDRGALYTYSFSDGVKQSLSVANPYGADFHPLEADSPDDDGDGIPDSVELGAVGLAVSSLNDADSGTQTDPDLADTDGDGLEDGEEDANLNGRLDEGETDPNDPDSDGDGWEDGEDCAPLDPEANPDALEVCDGIDNDCNGQVDDGFDEDGDGYGTCEATGGPLDCDDTRDDVYPDALELCDGLDNDCNGEVDEGFDADGDNFSACPAEGEEADCDDTRDDVYPGAEEVCDGLDQDCNGEVDDGLPTLVYYTDNDGDGYGDLETETEDCVAENPAGTVLQAGDCDDSDPTTYEGAAEVCGGTPSGEGVDNDCNGIVDDNPEDGTTFFKDWDGDGFGASSDVMACSAPEGYSALDGDCNDRNETVYPEADEICDGLDNDCDSSVDEEVRTPYYLDRDNDGFGDLSSEVMACDAPSGVYLEVAGDCDDFKPSINPDAVETCDGVDQDCDGEVDEGLDLYSYCQDADGDGHGDALAPLETCASTAPEGASSLCDDCDDTEKTVYPGAPELCDGKDQDCDADLPGGGIDEDLSELTYYADADGDGHGDPAVMTSTCAAAPEGMVSEGDDCNDEDSNVHPGASETPYDGVDQNCDGADLTDVDSDGYQALLVEGDDCDDDASDVYPGAPEVAYDGIDQDCDGTDLADLDGDGYIGAEAGGPDPSLLDCDDGNPAVHPGAVDVCGDDIDDDCSGHPLACGETDEDGDGFTPNANDCDDADVTVYPGAPELEDGKDNDCDGLIDEGTDAFDDDGDGFSEAEEDCDDTDAEVYPGADEQCGDDIDQDCDGVDMECSNLDLDGDGYSEADGDCDDSDPDIHPGALEDPQNTGYGDGLDNDCDDLVDEGTLRFDDDGDGYAEVDGDCDDGDPELSPGAEEVPYDGVDQDCDGSDLVDVDGDGFVAEEAGTGPGPFDCDDTDVSVYPGAEELEDGLDNDCNGLVDDLEVATPDVSPTPDPGDVSEGCTCNGAADQTGSGGPALLWFSAGLVFFSLRRRGHRK